MRIVQNILIGGAMMFFGFLLYPPYINYVHTPLYNMLKVQFPDLPVEQEIFWMVFPFVILFAIIGLGAMYVIGKKTLPGGGGDAGSGER